MPLEARGPVYRVALEPLEPLLFGDNRAARAGVDHVQLDQDPSPLTIHGAIGRYLAGKGWSRQAQEVLGQRQEDILAPEDEVAQLRGYCLQDARGVRCYPKPLHLRCDRSRNGAPRPYDLLRPEPVASAATSIAATHLLTAEPADEVKAPLWLSESALQEVLCGELPEGGVLDSQALFVPEPRPGIAVDNRRGTVREDHFFTRPYRRFAPGSLSTPDTDSAGYCAWFECLSEPSLPADGIGFLGGDRRRARFTFERVPGDEAPGLLALRQAVEGATADSAGFLLYLLTPAIAVEGDLLAPLGLGPPLVAASGKPRYVSGWNVSTNTPRPMLALVPEGSVFFFSWPRDLDTAGRRARIGELWLSAIGPRGQAAGFGRLLVGVWRWR